jgi:hypothetical protein
MTSASHSACGQHPQVNVRTSIQNYLRELRVPRRRGDIENINGPLDRQSERWWSTGHPRDLDEVPVVATVRI